MTNMKNIPTCNVHAQPRPRWCPDCARDLERAGSIALEERDINVLQRRSDPHTGRVSFSVREGACLEIPANRDPWT